MSSVRVTAVERVVRIVARGVTGVATVNVEAPLITTGGATPTLSIAPATPTTPGSLSAADKAKLDALADPTLSDALPQAVGNAGPGTSTRAARGDHVHAHGAQAGGGLHATATPQVAGFMSAADKTKLNSIAAGAQVNVPTNLGVGGTGDARTITSSTGSSAALPLATSTTAGLLSSFYFTLLSTFAANVRDQVLAMLQQGANITLTPSGTGASRTLTISSTASGGGGSGTVTSVGLSLPGIFAVSGSPVTGSGTLTATLASQTASRVWASPAGSDGPPVFRELVQSDIPALSAGKIVLSDDRLLGQIAGGSAAAQIALGTGLWFSGLNLVLSTNLQGWHAIAPSAKQDTLTPGSGISIVGNTISATGDGGSAVRPITVGFDAGRVNGVDQPLTTGLRFELRAPVGLEPTAWTLLPKAGSTGDITIEVRKRPFPSGTFTAITAGSPPSISAGARGTASASAWTAIDAGDLIEFEVTAVSGLVTGANLIIEATEA